MKKAIDPRNDPFNDLFNYSIYISFKDINIQILIKPLFVFIIYYLLYYIKKKQQ